MLIDFQFWPQLQMVVRTRYATDTRGYQPVDIKIPEIYLENIRTITNTLISLQKS